MSSPTLLGQRPDGPGNRARSDRERSAAHAGVRLLIITLAAALMAWGVSAVIGRGLPDPPSWPARLEIDHPRVVVLKSRRKLHLFDGDRLVRSYAIALGSQPTGQKVMVGDDRTPEGTFRVCSKNPHSQYRRFVGISYPDTAAARRGLREGRISRGEFQSIVAADQNGQCPPWTTALGGGIGIHGHGADRDWTAGCIALADADAIELFEVLRPGDVVEILP